MGRQIKICRDCRHYRVGKRENQHLCARFPHRIDLVTGKSLPEVKRCWEERYNIVNTEACGLQGLFWEPLTEGNHDER